LPEGKIPRHHGQYDAERLVNDMAGAVALTDARGLEQPLRVLGVVAARGRALRGFLDGRGNWLAHLEGHQRAEALLLRVKQLAEPGNRSGADGGRCAAPGAKRRRGEADPPVHLRCIVCCEGTDGFPGGGIDRRDGRRAAHLCTVRE